jgi:dipeptidase E
MELLLLSNSTNNGSDFLDHARSTIEEITNGARLVFVPFALADWDDYTDKVRDALSGVEVVGIHQLRDQGEVLRSACIFVGGGNTFRLLDTLRRLELLEPISERVMTGEIAYIGSSAGTNIACPTIRTTNDVPIIDVPLSALGLVPFQINPHYTDAVVPGLMTETRDERIAQFHEISPVPVLGLREGAWLRVSGPDRVIGGTGGARMFERGGVTEVHAGDRLDRWWDECTDAPA